MKAFLLPKINISYSMSRNQRTVPPYILVASLAVFCTTSSLIHILDCDPHPYMCEVIILNLFLLSSISSNSSLIPPNASHKFSLLPVLPMNLRYTIKESCAIKKWWSSRYDRSLSVRTFSLTASWHLKRLFVLTAFSMTLFGSKQPLLFITEKIGRYTSTQTTVESPRIPSSWGIHPT